MTACHPLRLLAYIGYMDIGLCVACYVLLCPCTLACILHLPNLSAYSKRKPMGFRLELQCIDASAVMITSCSMPHEIACDPVGCGT